MENLSETVLAELRREVHPVLSLDRDMYRGISLNFERVLGFEGMKLMARVHEVRLASYLFSLSIVTK